MMLMLCLPTAAYANGTKSIYDNGGTKLGFAEMWTNNVSTGRVLYSQTTSTLTQNYVATQSLIKGMQGWSTVFRQTEIMNDTNAKLSPVAALSIPDTITPIDARVVGGINTYVVGLCKGYNLGSGAGTCSDGTSCDFATDFYNN